MPERIEATVRRVRLAPSPTRGGETPPRQPPGTAAVHWDVTAIVAFRRRKKPAE